MSRRETTEAALRAREAELARVQRIGRVGGFEIDLRGGMFRNRRSREYLDVHGLPPEAAEEAHEAWVRRLHPEDREQAEQRFKIAVLGNGPDYSSEYRIVTPGGAVRWISATAEIERDAAGAPLRMIGVHIDVTRIKEAERALRASEGRLRDVLEAIDEAFYSLDADERVVDVSRRALEMWGLDAGDVLGRRLVEIFPRVEDGVIYQAMRRGMRTGQRSRIEGPAVSLNGRWVEQDSYPTADGGMAVAFRDIHDRKQTEMALRQSEAQFRTLAEAMLNHVWTARPDGGLDWFNERVYEYSGAAAGDMDGTGWTRIVHPDDLPGAAARWAAALASGHPYEAEFRLRRADGVYRWHIARAVGLRADNGAIARWIGTNTDIDDQKSITRALADLNSTLEQQVADRTGELMAAEEALRQSQKMEAVGQLTGGIAHDFNNLLTGIRGSLELLRTRVAQGRINDIDRYITAAQEASKRAAALTHRLLAFSRQQTLEPKSISLNRLANMEELIRRTVGPEIAVDVVTSTALWNSHVDPNQLENALLNLCINARDAMPHGGRLTIETSNEYLDERAARERDLSPGQYVSLCVGDTGSGMAPDVIARAFDPFFTTKPMGQGTGLGLSMVYGFVRQSGGQVRIDSVLGQGTKVRLYLPRHLGGADAPEAPAPPSDPPRGGYEKTVLVVDDDATVRMLVTEVLGDLGCTAVGAVDGATGLAILRSDARIDLLVTDVGLPGGVNGRQLAEAAHIARPGLKVLFITGYAENAVLNHGHLEGGMRVLTKPFAMDSLARRISELMIGAPLSS